MFPGNHAGIRPQSYATIPGFYDNAHEVSLSEIQEEVEARGEFSVAQFQAAIGVPALTTGKRVAEVLHRRWCVPALSITDVRVNQHEVGKASYGPTRFSVVPKSVVGHVSVRYVPGQASSFLIRQMHQHLQHEFSKLRSANTVTMTVRSSGSWWEADVESELMQCVEAAIESVWGQQPMHVREGGTMPVTSELENLLQAPAVLIPFGQSSDR